MGRPATTADSVAPADSAGQPWAGRAFEENASAADDGSAPEGFVAAVRAFAAGERGADAVVDAMRTSRFLIPLVAHLGEAGENEHGVTIDKKQELSIVTVTGPDGRHVLPVFSSVDAMREWNPLARPVPADGRRVALAASGENTDLVVIDPTTAGEFVVRRPAVWSVARGLPWLPASVDPAVRSALLRAAADEPDVLGIETAPGDPEQRMRGPELVVEVRLVDGLDASALDGLLARLGERWSADETIAQRVDSMAVKLVR